MLDPLGGVCVCLSVSGLTGERRGSQVTFWIGYNSQTCSGRDLNPVCDIWRYIFHEHSHPYKHSDVTGLGRWGARLSVQWWTSRSLLLLRVHTSLGDTLHHYQLENSSINSSKCCLRTFLCNFTLKTSQVYTSWRLDVNDGRDMAPAVFSDNCQSWAVIYIYIYTHLIYTLEPLQVCTGCLWPDHGALPENLRTAPSASKETIKPILFHQLKWFNTFKKFQHGISILPKSELSECVLIVGEEISTLLCACLATTLSTMLWI